MPECQHKKVWIYSSAFIRPGRIHICTQCFCYMKHKRNYSGWIYFRSGNSGYNNDNKDFMAERYGKGVVIDNV